MKSVKSILLIAALFCFLLVANSVVAETGIETDPEDDVIAFNQNLNTGETEQTETADVPGADIVEVSYDRVDGGTEVTISFNVNDRGQIETLDLYGMEDENELMDLLLNSSDPLPLAYSAFVMTDQFEYEVVYEGGNCTLNYGDELDYTIDGNEFSATFNLNNASESITKIGAQSFFMDFSLTSSKVYMDAAPDSFLFMAEITAPSTANTGEEIEFTGATYNLADLFDMGVTETNYTYEWDFDDGSTGTGETVTHAYQHPGSYTVELTVADSEGTETTTTSMVTVSEGTTSNGDSGDNGDNPNSGDGTENDNTLMIFIAIIGIIVVIGVVALVVVIRR
jgi:hypothetical protein